MRALVLLFAGAAVLYSSAFAMWYSTTPLGLFPVLDGREILELARRMASGELAREPFYRAPAYPALLSLPLRLGLAADHLPLVARGMNLVLHWLSAVLVWRIAFELWRRPSAAWLATALFVFNPVVLHFVVDPLDITLAITLMLGAIAAAVSGESVSRRRYVLAAVLFTLAGLVRPQLLLLLPAWIACLLWPKRAGLASLAAAIVPALLLLVAMGLVSLAWSGEFRVLPGQGAFNLWAANHDGANGRYFVQRERLAVYDGAENPARLEAERRYRQARPHGPFDRASMQAYWRQRLIDDVLAAPGAWLGLVVSKGFYLLNNFEQYNNKTYHVHKQRSPWLAPNPLCWAVLLIGAAAALFGARPPRHRGLLLALVSGLVIALLLTYVSARFRLPLAPVLAILAGGFVAIERARLSFGGGAAIVALALLAFWPLPREERERTVIQDHLLLARAANELGEHAAAYGAARTALLAAPEHPAALELVCVSRFNGWLHADASSAASVSELAAECERATAVSPVAQRITGTLWWRQGDSERGLAILRELARGDGPERHNAQAALAMMGDPVPEHVPAAGPAELADALVLALAARGDESARAEAGRRFTAAGLARELAAMERLYRR